MRTAYVDTSFLLAAAFHERSSERPLHTFDEFAVIVASRFLEAEYLSAYHREAMAPNYELLGSVQLVDATSSLRDQVNRVLEAGYVSGADCWHLATALYVSPDPGELTFLTLDARQRAVAKHLGFRL